MNVEIGRNFVRFWIFGHFHSLVGANVPRIHLIWLHSWILQKKLAEVSKLQSCTYHVKDSINIGNGRHFLMFWIFGHFSEPRRSKIHAISWYDYFSFLFFFFILRKKLALITELCRKMHQKARLAKCTKSKSQGLQFAAQNTSPNLTQPTERLTNPTRPNPYPAKPNPAQPKQT